MAIVAKNQQPKQSTNRRRKKKRRTEDFSDSDSDSDSSPSSSGEELQEDKKDTAENSVEDEDIVLSDTEISHEDPEIVKESNIKSKLKTINLTQTVLNNNSTKNVNINEISNTLKNSRKDLEDEFLGLMFENYGDDINNLRNAPDFNERSLSILADVLKNGGNIFDQDTLKAVVNK